ncbi:hypothetical protein BU25DRAFT_12579 [Macroventuria anomochaeta]|uniref:Uncharacterized protein n=1 Tax=Macroventuria anomochaeta TaxID=301207 RepID=A0ACB6SJN6_9PLEO|nr:uncharacterized protein BU25DRAFT_12579 [Macroventuria anomochaeta]KAF2633758.1 hypothetical protein BU25DRAFT_12579 [Macroventuria anomochaeta]
MICLALHRVRRHVCDVQDADDDSKNAVVRGREFAKGMLDTTDPKVHKALGWKVRWFVGRVWDENKFEIVVQGHMHKFTVSEDAESLRKWLLVEASPMDRIWGIGFADKNAGANRHRWGQNLLGKALMEVRTRLRGEEGKERKEKVGGAGAAEANV